MCPCLGLLGYVWFTFQTNLIEYETWHGVIWLDGEDQEARLGYEGPNCKREGQARDSGAMDRQGAKVRVEDLAPMDQGNGEE